MRQRGKLKGFDPARLKPAKVLTIFARHLRAYDWPAKQWPVYEPTAFRFESTAQHNFVNAFMIAIAGWMPSEHNDFLTEAFGELARFELDEGFALTRAVLLTALNARASEKDQFSLDNEDAIGVWPMSKEDDMTNVEGDKTSDGAAIGSAPAVAPQPTKKPAPKKAAPKSAPAKPAPMKKTPAKPAPKKAAPKSSKGAGSKPRAKLMKFSTLNKTGRVSRGEEPTNAAQLKVFGFVKGVITLEKLVEEAEKRAHFEPRKARNVIRRMVANGAIKIAK